MTTKDQEMKALEQIKKIVEGLGEDSYIGFAMIGVFEDAEKNIENDWACSNYDRWQMAEKRIIELKQEMLTLRERCDNLDTLRVEETRKVRELRAEVERHQSTSRRLQNICLHNDRKFAKAEDEIIRLKDNIIHLKAKLYDATLKDKQL